MKDTRKGPRAATRPPLSLQKETLLGQHDVT